VRCYGRCIADDIPEQYNQLNYIDNFSMAAAPHSHSMVLRHGNALIFRRKFFLREPKNRLPDPSETRALKFKEEFPVRDLLGFID